MIIEQLEAKVFENTVLADSWTQEEQVLFENALLDYPSSVSREERWQLVSNAVGSKSKQQCLARYKFLKAFVAQYNHNNNNQIVA
jgi:DnaJ homolog subfamily C member 1